MNISIVLFFHFLEWKITPIFYHSVVGERKEYHANGRSKNYSLYPKHWCYTGFDFLFFKIEIANKKPYLSKNIIVE